MHAENEEKNQEQKEYYGCESTWRNKREKNNAGKEKEETDKSVEEHGSTRMVLLSPEYMLGHHIIFYFNFLRLNK